MDPRHYGKIGTTARAEPVNNQEILFPNGYDRNQNRERPLVTVCDTAGVDEEDFTDEDFGFDSNGPSENVTVTIKFSSALDGIVTETDSRNSNTLDSRTHANSNDFRKKAKAKDSFEEPTNSVPDRSDFHILPQAQHQVETEENGTYEPSAPGTVSIEQSSNCHKLPTENKTGNSVNFRDNLYEEYERFVAPSERQCDTVVRPKSYSTKQPCNEDLDSSEKREKPKVKIVYETTESPQREFVDRSELVSPIYKTPIIKETSSTSGDEAEDFLEYLKQLKGSNEDSIAEDTDSFDTGEERRQNFIELDRKNECDRSECVTSFSNELVPILSVHAIVVSNNDSKTNTEVIVISDDDDEDNDKDKHKSLLEFNFSSLKQTKHSSGGNGSIAEEIEISSDSDSSYDKILPENSKRKKKTRKKKASKNADGDKETDDSNKDDSEEDDDQDEESGNNSDRGDNNDNDNNHNNDDDRDDNDKKYDKSDNGSSDNGSENGGCDDNDRNSGHNSDRPEPDSDSTQSDEYENEGYFSPGMRSRSEDISDLDSSDKQPSDLSSNVIKQDSAKEMSDTDVIDSVNDLDSDESEIKSISSKMDNNTPLANEAENIGEIIFAQNKEDHGSDILRDNKGLEAAVDQIMNGNSDRHDLTLQNLERSEIGRLDTSGRESLCNTIDENTTDICNSGCVCLIDTISDGSIQTENDTNVSDNLIRMDDTVTERDNIIKYEQSLNIIGADNNLNTEYDRPYEKTEDVEILQNFEATEDTAFSKNETNLCSDKIFHTTENDNINVSDTNVSKNLNEEDKGLHEADVLSTCSSSLTAEDNEIIEILDYSETINNLKCKFQTIDTYVIEEYESLSNGEHSGSTTDSSEVDDRFYDIVPEQLTIQDQYKDVQNESDENNLHGKKDIGKDLHVLDLDSKQIFNSSIFNPDLSEEGSFCSMAENDGQCSDLSLSSEPSRNPSPGNVFQQDVDPANVFDICLLSDSSSTGNTDREESDFESALDEEFWNKTVGSASEMSFSDTFSDIEAENADVTEAVQHHVDYSQGKKTSNSESDENSLNCDNTQNIELNIESSSEQDSEGKVSEYESADDVGSSCEGESDFVRKIESRIPLNKTEVSEDNRKISKTEDVFVETISNHSNDKGSVDVKHEQVSLKDGLLANKFRENALKALKDRPIRTISYFAPFIKDQPVLKIIPGRERRLEFICKLRKGLLEKLLPLKSSVVTNDENSIKFLDSEQELQCTIIDLKRKSKLCNNGDQSRKIGKPGEIQKIGKPGEIIKLGVGYYIFGAGEKLDLPIGPKLKTNNESDLDRDPCRPSIYFRGVPGIINHAYKMSSFSFPKLAVPTDTASRKILHACNRLATQLSPVEPRHDHKYDTMNQDMAIEDTDDTLSVSSADLTDMLMASRDFLNSSRFDDAEAGFLKLYKEIQEKPEDNGRLLVETLTGLADICIRRSRMCRSNPLEWQWLCMHAIALLQYTVEFCDSELENQLDNEATEWYQEQRQASELKCRPLEDAFTRALYNCLKHDANFFDPFQSFSLPNTPVSQHRKPNLFPLSSTMPQYLLVPGMSYRVTDQGLKKQSSDDSDVAVDWLAKFQFYCKDRLQTKDAKCVTEKVLKSTKSTDNEDTESLMSNGSHGSLDWDNSDLHGIDELEIDITEKESPITDYSLEYELASSETDNEGWDFFLHQRRNCDLQSVVQVVANDEEKCDVNERENSSIDKETQDIYQQEKSEKSRKKHHEPRDIVSPLHAHSISLTLARSFCRLADKLVQEEEYKKAEIVYEKILDIIDAIQDGTAGMLRFSARIMKNLGTVKSKQGKSSSGLVLLNKALNTYRDLQDEEANFEIAVALIELGNGYIVGKNHEDSVFDDVIIAICDFFEKDASDSSSTSTSSSVQSHISQMTSSLTSNTEDRNVEEAVTCYTEAITLLDCYQADEKQVDMFAKAIMRLGDCHFMQKDYDKALECYEKALGMFRSYNIFGKDSLMENAHVLCMLGVSSFMLHVYPRAASVFETALHMVRCAYGFKRTFLNGMLQSLSGITYYKMKNYHKCVSMCYQGYETYCELFGEGMSRLDKQKFWLVCQTLYVMGNSYNILSLQQKAMKYLSIARSLMKSSKSRERRQFMRVLQILGDCYFANYDYKTALTFYNEALEYGECESSISFDEVFDPNCASDEMTIHNHLVSKSAEAHLSMQQYQNAVHYLEQAHDMQEVMGEDIKGDLINTLHQLGHMHSVAGDVDKAIESYKECLEVFREIHKGKLEPEMCTTLGNLAAICYVKACIADTLEEEDQMNRDADAYFHEALDLENNAEVCVKYGNFLFSQCNFETAIVHFWNALRNDSSTADIVYRGLEKVTLPELLQDEVDTHDEICLPSSCLARYLLILSHKALHELEEAEINLICLMEEVLDYDVPLLHSLLGYAMMELMLFEEAAVCFLTAAETEEEYQLACENYCICVLILLQKTILSGLENILDFVSKHNPKFCIDYSF